MCNIITFRFTCQHTLRRRRSRCGGTKHKITAHGTKAACIAESFLTISLQISCDRCRLQAWEATWKSKLERASTFLWKLQGRDMPGIPEITTLVNNLEAEYATASWNTRTMFAHGPKPSVTRVKHGYYKKVSSKLLQEVKPEDVMEKTEKEWAEMDEEDYDGDYEASTDPVHPVCTDYEIPGDDDDGAWIVEYLKEAGIGEEQGGEGVGFENGHGWSWGGENNELGAQTVASVEQRTGGEQIEEEESSRASGCRDTSLMAWGPDVDAPTMIGGIDLIDMGAKEADHKAKVDEVIKTFWSIVNQTDSDAEHQPAAPTPLSGTSSLASLVKDLSIGSSQDS